MSGQEKFPNIISHGRPFDVRTQTGRSRAVIRFLILLGFVIACIIVLFNVYQYGVRDREEFPVIRATNESFKIKAQENPGMQNKQQGQLAYEVMAGEASPSSVEPTPVLVPDPQFTPAIEPQLAVPRPALTLPEEEVARGPSYYVQIASLRTQEAAEDEWQRFQRRFQAELALGYFADIKKVNIEGRGQFYRLRVGGFTSKLHAAGLCDQLKGKDQACFVTTAE